MENKINIACFKEGYRTAEVKDIWQWDYGQILRIQGLNLPTAVEIHFSLDEHGGEAVRRIGITKDGVTDVPIPDSMVENESAYGDSYYFFAYIYLTDETSGNTEYKIRAKVSTRSKPEAFDKPEDEELFRQAIDAVGKSADRAEDAEKSAEAWAHGHEEYPERDEDNAAYYAASAHDSMIETQHLAERVHSDADATARNAALAEQYKSQAAQSAADALQSEQNAKASETAAQEARAGAETAEGQAELFAAQAEEDKNTVEQGKAVVMEIGQKVEDNKKTVEQTVDNFELLHEQAVADVNNAGQAQTERVNESGETAVDNIEFSSKQAVQYVANEGATQVANVQAAAEEIAGKVAQIEQNTQGISELNRDLVDHVKESQKAISELADKKITKFYANSLGETTLNDSDNGKIQDMMMYGKSEQKSYSGKNLFKAKNEGIITVTDDGLLLNGTTEFHQFINFTIPAGSYFIGEMNGDNHIHSYIDNFDLYMNEVGAITFETDKMLSFYIAQGTYSNMLIKPYIVEGSNPMETYEPYVGGIPSPNPDYPQEIQSVVNPTVKVWTDVGTAGKYLTFEQIETVKDNLNLFYNKKGVLFRKSNIYPSETTNTDSTSVYWFYNDENSLKSARILSSGVFENAITVGNISDMPESNNDLQIYKGLASYGVYYFSNTEYKTVSLETTLNISNYTKTEVALPYTLNAIPVDSGGNVTIDGQEYIADYVDVERGKLVRMVDKHDLGAVDWTRDIYDGNYYFYSVTSGFKSKQGYFDCLCSQYRYVSYHSVKYNDMSLAVQNNNANQYIVLKNDIYTDASSLKSSLNGVYVYFILETPTEIDLTDEEVQAFRDLATYYPTTNVFVTSDQLDGYTEFNYPVSLAEGWNYVKQQLGDTRDYIYDMDLQSAEAYVNSEYAVALTELEV